MQFSDHEKRANDKSVDMPRDNPIYACKTSMLRQCSVLGEGVMPDRDTGMWHISSLRLETYDAPNKVLCINVTGRTWHRSTTVNATARRPMCIKRSTKRWHFRRIQN